MQVFDVFNGDADGILSLVQLRRAEPRPEAVLVTGRKREIKLLERINPNPGDQLTVLDISMASNGAALRSILAQGASVFYVDHHNPGDIPDHENLISIIDSSPEICTALLVDQCLGGAYRAWAVTAAFGDNFPRLARRYAQGYDLPLESLERLGQLINYNSYGSDLKDLHYPPASLYQMLVSYETPMEFLRERPEIFNHLDQAYEADMALAQSAKIIDQSAAGKIIELADQSASRRISGLYGNQLAQNAPDHAHAILTLNGSDYVVSVRAPLARRHGADRLCLQFETGGGRSAAAGINRLPASELERFTQAFHKVFGPDLKAIR